MVGVQLIRWRHVQRLSQTVIMGLLLGGLLLSKFYAPPLVLVALVLMLIVGPDDDRLLSRKLNWKPALAAGLIALVVLWAGYFFHISHLQIAEGHVHASFPNRRDRVWDSKTSLRLSIFVPAGEFVEGFREVARSNQHGRPAWFLGRMYPHGAGWKYYPVTILLKWPTMLVLLALLSIALALRAGPRMRPDLLLLFVFPAVFFCFAITARFNIGERHILPLYPFALLIAGGIWEHARSSKLGMTAIVLALCLNAADALRYAPDYLSYFNILVRPQNSWRLLTDSNLDWGQGLITLRNYQQHHPDEALHLAYFGSVNPALYGIQATPLAGHDEAKGIIAIGATLLSGQTLEDPDAYHWLWQYAPERAIDHTMWLYKVK
jgi:hypothetical protein